MLKKFFLSIVFLLQLLILLTGIYCEPPKVWNKQNPVQAASPEGITEAKLSKMSKDEIINYLKTKISPNDTSANKIVDMSKSLSFRVLNKTNKHVFVKCFYWMRNKSEGPFRWDNTDVYELKPSETKLIMIDDIPEERDRKNCIGFLGVFDNATTAKNSHKLLCDESKLIDLDSLYILKDKLVTLVIKKYGIAGEQVEYTTSSRDFIKNNPSHDRFNLLVENQTGQDALITCFIYEQPEGRSEFELWRYDKTPIQRIKNKEVIRIALPEVNDNYRWSYMRAILGVFWQKDKKIAQASTLELLDPEEKIKLGLLSGWKDKKVVLTVENYGVLGDFIDYVVKPLEFYDRRKNIRTKFQSKKNTNIIETLA